MTRNLAFAVVVALGSLPAIAQEEPAPEKKAANAEERELLDLASELQTKQTAFYERLGKLSDPAAQKTYFLEQDPARDFVPKLLAFEERHRGKYAGLMALRSIVVLAGGSGLEGAPFTGRREAMKRLPAYAERIELASILGHVRFGRFDPQCEEFLRALSKAQNANPTVRELSKIMLAGWMLEIKHAREHLERRLQELKNGAEPEIPAEREMFAETLTTLPTFAQMAGWEKEAVELLRTAAESKSDLREPSARLDDPQGCLLRIDVERSKTMPRLAEMAEGKLFKELHLQIGRAAPDFKVPLITGGDWELSAQKGKVVIVQFSSKGCGPCEAMYPDLRKIQTEYGPKVSVLSVMADEKQLTTAAEVGAGKLTWDVHWDGAHGPLALRWGVYAFPTVYVFDSKGIVAGEDLRGKPLLQKVAELVKETEPAKKS
jgi:thiol-disulfide isomerase/thioredoxin